ncbi:thioesterase family protein [Treponema sp.]|uniref:acyl-CoA thioesterase n=1 Tax=Treponema sp. TaxID=166 RepID=UPI0025FF9FA7|nr:thioesterase family protein [Treponema sp.]MCR5218042.1 acyl-CoA thioesterase [Treponema sp.]
MTDKKKITEEIVFNVEFYDVDSMKIVYHGNYIKYMEKARCALLDKIGYGYLQMEETGYSFPVVDVKVKYVRSLRFGDRARVKATLVEYENCLKVKYEIYNDKTGELTTKCESTQMVVEMATGETKFFCPQIFIDRVKELE